MEANSACWIYALLPDPPCLEMFGLELINTCPPSGKAVP